MKSVNDLKIEIVQEFSADFLDEDLCRNWFLHKLHPEGVFCPGCGKEVVSERRLTTLWDMGRITCPAESCEKTFSLLSGTTLNGLGMSFRVLYLLLFMLGCGVSASKVSGQLGISTAAAYIWANKAKGTNDGLPERRSKRAAR